jgi:hypothetical protein
LIFLFLKKFGRNEFDIPIYYQHNTDSLNRLCNTRYIDPYTLADSVLKQAQWQNNAATIFVFNNDVPVSTEFNRLADIFPEKEYKIITMDEAKTGRHTYQRWHDCVFFMKAPWDIVLVDGSKRIRGYYAGNSREEFDRLILEMKILLNKY